MGKIRLAALKPTDLISRFGIPDFQPVAMEVEKTFRGHPIYLRYSDKMLCVTLTA